MEVQVGKTVYFTLDESVDPHRVGSFSRYIIVDETGNPIRMKHSGSSSTFYVSYPILSVAEARARALNRVGMKVRVLDKREG